MYSPTEEFDINPNSNDHSLAEKQILKSLKDEFDWATFEQEGNKKIFEMTNDKEIRLTFPDIDFEPLEEGKDFNLPEGTELHVKKKSFLFGLFKSKEEFITVNSAQGFINAGLSIAQQLLGWNTLQKTKATLQQ